MASIILLLAGIFQGCTYNSMPEHICFEGEVIGRIRSGGGGIAVSMDTPSFGSHRWRGYKNVIEALNIPHELYQPGQRIFFRARQATEEEKSFPITADGDESEKPIVYVLAVSAVGCPD